MALISLGLVPRLCTELSTLRFHTFGKEAVKACGVSPDAFAQLALQIVFHRLYGRCPPTYEAVSVTSFASPNSRQPLARTRAAPSTRALARGN